MINWTFLYDLCQMKTMLMIVILKMIIFMMMREHATVPLTEIGVMVNGFTYRQSN